ncbi:MAG: aminotransferase class V-fold PLP-dependent enzyme [Clostridia bacterium]|nr:aminotransferase class V-fold PLP-dependent enzyme [Clostridia bacterium]
MSKSLLEKLKEHSVSPYHMPGHKRQAIAEGLPYDIDITEIEGFDNLHCMQGILKETAQNAKSLYKSCESFPLVNGSTCGVLAGIYSMTRENKNILIARNCHKSVYHAVEVLGLNATYIMPEALKLGIMGKVTPQSVEEAIKNTDIGSVVITSPTYEGVISDVAGIYKVCKEHGVLLFVDCAHGAHFIDELVPCDICVMSLHKTLPSLTQTALLHIYSDRIDADVVRHGLSIFETSSPSYVLLASIDECLRYVAENKKDFKELSGNLAYFYEKAVALDNIRVFHFDDAGKIIISATDAQDLAHRLRQHNIEVEMVSEHYVMAMVTIADKLNDFQILLRALYRIDKTLPPYKICEISELTLPEKGEDFGESEFLDIGKCEGKVSKEYIWAYPPGVPVIAPVEVFDSQIIKYLKSKKDLKSTKGKFPEICVKKEN